MHPVDQQPLPWERKIAAWYLVLVACLGIALLFAPSTEYPGVPPKSAAAKAGGYTREGVLSLAYVVAGIAILRRRRWASRFAVGCIIVAAFYTGKQFAWGFAGGRPTLSTLLMSYVAVGLWDALWIWLLIKRPVAVVAPRQHQRPSTARWR
jgi:hypothetical protein